MLVTDYASGRIYSTTDTDGQHASTTPVLPANYGGGPGIAGLATLNGTVYMVEQGPGTVGKLDTTTGNYTSIASVPAATDILADPSGALYVSGLGNGIYRITNLGGTPVVNHFSTVGADGISLSADGLTLYAASGGHLVAVSTTTGLVTRDYGVVGGGIDGTALGTGTLAGQIFANTNGGQVIEVDLVSGLQTLIAQGGSRGDLVKVDPTDGSLLLTQTDSVLRLTAPAGAGFGTTPEPSTFLSSAIAGLVGLGYAWRRRRARRAD